MKIDADWLSKPLYIVVDERPACGSIRKILSITFSEEIASAVAEENEEEYNVRVDKVNSYDITKDSLELIELICTILLKRGMKGKCFCQMP